MRYRINIGTVREPAATRYPPTNNTATSPKRKINCAVVVAAPGAISLRKEQRTTLSSFCSRPAKYSSSLEHDFNSELCQDILEHHHKQHVLRPYWHFLLWPVPFSPQIQLRQLQEQELRHKALISNP